VAGITLPYQLFLSFALGEAAAPAIVPFAQSLQNDAWAAHTVKPPDVYTLAEGVAQGQVDEGTARGWAHQQGISDDAFTALVSIANTGMPLGLAFDAFRRGNLSDGQLRTQFNRAGIEPQWWDALDALKAERLDLGAIATAVHRGIMADDGLLVTPAPTGPGNIARIPVSTLDTLGEFASHGIDPERARVLIADTGLPLSLGEMLQLYNRGEVTADDVRLSVAEGNIRNEYMDVALALSRRLLTPHEYAEAELRGIMTTAQAQAGAALSGLNAADYATLFANLGRPLTAHQIVTGEARGGTYGGDYTDVPAGPFRDAIRRSAIRPEYASLAYANRYTYPSGFQIKAEAPTLGQAQTKELLLEVGWSPKWADVFSAQWTGGSTGTATDPHLAKAQTQLWTTTHRGYVTSRIDDAEATQALQVAGVQASAIPDVLTIWQAERALDRKPLSAAQVKKAWAEQVTNPDTGAPWTRDEAVAYLIELGYSASDAATFIEL